MARFAILGIALFAVIANVASQNICDVAVIPANERIDCYPEPFPTQARCEARGCSWCAAGGLPNGPACVLPKTHGYKFSVPPVQNADGFSFLITRSSTTSYYGSDINVLKVEGFFQSNERLRIKITDAVNANPRWEVPLDIQPGTGGNANPLYEVKFFNEPTFSFQVIRKSTGVVLFDTSMGGLTFSEQFLQFTTKLPTANLYGIGENEQHSFRHDTSNYLNWPLYGRDQPPDGNANMYGVQPYYTVLETGGTAHSVAIVNSNAQDFTILPTPGILYRTIGGVLDLNFFLGPTPENVVQQFTQAVGRAPLPPYWALGFQLCRYGYNSIANMKRVVDRTRAAGIPYDAQYGDIDIMDRERDFTISADRFAGLGDYVKQLKTEYGIKFITILDPCISIGEPAGSYRAFDLGQTMDVWVKKADGVTPVVGKVWPPDPIYFPDYTKQSTKDWWRILMEEFQTILNFDAIWIDMNEPANFVNGDISEGCALSQYNNPPYVPKIRGGHLADKTICGEHRDTVGKHYDTHSLYGWFQSEPTLTAVKAALPGKRGFILSRSTFLGSGKWAAHWLGDNWSLWTNLHYSIIGILQFNQFGIPFVGPDTCGFIWDANKDLCQRWQMLGAFYPFSRNHNGLGYVDQDPAAWGPDVAASSRAALWVRYTLLPYLYTLFYVHATEGNTVVRALWHEYPTDSVTANIDRQFLWGSGFLVTPVIEKDALVVAGYLPNARVYEYFSGVEETMKGAYKEFDTPMDKINLHVIGGNILPTQVADINTVESRQNPLGLIVALNDEQSANGQLYYDAGDSPDPLTTGDYFRATFAATPGRLVGTIVTDGYEPMKDLKIDEIRIFGVAAPVTTVTVNGVAHDDVEATPGGLVIHNAGIVSNVAFTVTFTST